MERYPMMLQAEHLTMMWSQAQSAQLPLACVGCKQALTSLHLVPEETLRWNDSIHEVTTPCVQEPTVKIKDDFASIIRDHTERAAMARPSVWRQMQRHG
jgi:hypothetical protein